MPRSTLLISVSRSRLAAEDSTRLTIQVGKAPATTRAAMSRNVHVNQNDETKEKPVTVTGAGSMPRAD